MSPSLSNPFSPQGLGAIWLADAPDHGLTNDECCDSSLWCLPTTTSSSSSSHDLLMSKSPPRFLHKSVNSGRLLERPLPEFSKVSNQKPSCFFSSRTILPWGFVQEKITHLDEQRWNLWFFGSGLEHCKHNPTFLCRIFPFSKMQCAHKLTITANQATRAMDNG